ncbi:MAG: type II secretion system secretin GspD [Pseudomonadota bacterium]
MTDFVRHSLSPFFPRASRVLLLSALSVLVSSCAVLDAPEQAAPPVVTPPPAAAAVPAAPEPTVAEPIAERGDNGISRPGRVIQLGQFVEEVPQGTPPANDVVQLNYEQQDLRVVIEELGDALGINTIIDPTIDYKVSLRTSANNPLRYQDIWPLLRMLARNAGVAIDQAGNVWQFRRSTSNVPTEILLPGSLGDAVSSDVLQVTPLTYISVEALEPILAPMLQPTGTVIRMGAANLIGITGSPEQLARVNALLAVIDDDPFMNQGIQLYQLLNSPAAEVAEELTNVLKLIEGEQSSYQVLGLDRINSVLVIAPANRGFDEVNRWVDILDAESQEQVEQLFVYKVKNLDAPALGETLSNVYDPDDEEDEARAARAAADGTLQQSVIQRADGTSVVVAGPPGADLVAAQLQDGAASADISVNIVSDENTNSLLVRATPREYRQLLTTINSLDSVPLQVVVNAAIGQVTLSDGNQFGIDWTRVSSNLASGPARLTGRFLPGAVIDNANPAGQGRGLVLTKTFMDGATVIDATLKAIQQDNEVHLLSRPTVIATNNHESELVVGQAVPINNGSTSTGTGIVTANITYRDVGVVLKITPRINEDGYIYLEIEQSLSSVEEGNTEGVADNPTFVNQEITTTVVVADQETITLGGLIQEENSDTQNGVPLLQDIPVLGRAFSYSELRNTRRELFVILRPQIVYGDERNAVLMQEMRARFAEVTKLLEEAGL